MARHLVSAATVVSMLTVGLFAQRGAAPAIPNLAGKVLTVRGPIDPAAIGPTLMHEHIFINFRTPEKAGSWAPAPPPPPTPQGQTGRQGPGMGRPPGWNLLNNYEESLAEVMEFKKAGGGTIVDVTNFGLSRNPEWLKRISEASGLNVVMGAGWYQKALHPPDMSERTVEELTDIIVRDIVAGAQGTNIRSGIIGEVGVGDFGGKGPLTENEIKSVRASARASRLTGAPITTHSFAPPGEMQRVLDLIASEGVDLNHVVLGHTGTGNLPLMKSYTERGAYIEFDYIGDAPQAPDDGAGLRQLAERRAQQIKTLIDGGLTDRILVAQDICTQPQLKKNGGGGFAFTSNLVIPALKTLGVNDEIIRRIMVDNPRRVLTFVAPRPQAGAK